MSRPEHAASVDAAQVARLHEDLLRWYEAERRDLPWRRTRDPYAIWVSEIMLQQTRVDTVIPYYERFLARFPNAMALADAPEDDVLAMWSGLGYYRRARLLHAGARAVAERGAVPNDREGLLAVPGIGRYTAGAVASIAFGEPVGLVDGNVARVLSRVFLIEDDMRKAGMRKAEALADAIVAARDPGAWNQALMELGATICTPQRPLCARCPIASSCRARAEGRQEELPVLAPKKKPEARRVQALVATRGKGENAGVLLLRRKRDLLFGGLWEPPCLEGTLAARKDLARRFGVKDAKPSGKVTHVLSHRKLTIDVARGSAAEEAVHAVLPDEYDAARFVAPDAFAGLGIATLARKILAAAMIE
jgi:A/G-specific adenine glycosylase